MAISTSPGDGRLRFADRLAAARRRHLVERAAELAPFGSALAEE